jgi:hypothetical protein
VQELHRRQRGEIEVLHAKRERLEEPQPALIEQARNQMRDAIELRQHRTHLLGREHDRKPSRRARTHQALENAVIAAAPISAGCPLPWKRMKRRVQWT